MTSTTNGRPVRLLILAGLVLTMLTQAGCRGEGRYLARRDSIAFDAGDAIAHNKAVQTVDPWPHYAKNPRLRTDGKRMMIAVGRYQANQSLEPQGMATNELTVDVDESAPPAPPVNGNGGKSD